MDTRRRVGKVIGRIGVSPGRTSRKWRIVEHIKSARQPPPGSSSGEPVVDISVTNCLQILYNRKRGHHSEGLLRLQVKN